MFSDQHVRQPAYDRFAYSTSHYCWAGACTGRADQVNHRHEQAKELLQRNTVTSLDELDLGYQRGTGRSWHGQVGVGSQHQSEWASSVLLASTMRCSLGSAVVLANGLTFYVVDQVGAVPRQISQLKD